MHPVEQYLGAERTDETLKSTDASELSFIGQVVKQSLEAYGSDWDMSVTGALMLGVACKGNVGMALYMLDKMQPQPGQVLTDNDVVRAFPLGFQGDWDAEWDAFRERSPDQRDVFRPAPAVQP